MSVFRRAVARALAFAPLAVLTLACGLTSVPGLEPVWNYAHYGPCLVDDVNGDGVGEVAATLYQDWETHYAALLDGATGEQIWRGPAYQGASTQAYCVGPSHFAVVPPGVFRIDVYPVRGEGVAQQVSLSDRPQRYGVAEGCFTVRTSNGEGVGVQLGERVERGSCAATPERSGLDHINTGEADWDGGVSTVSTFGDATYQLRFRERGTELIQVGRVGAWNRELNLLAVETGSRAALVAVPDGVVVIGQPHPEPDDDTANVLGLNAADGTTRYEVSISDRYTVGLGAVVYNGRYVVAGMGNTLRAFDPATGQIAWMLGTATAPGPTRRTR